MTSDLPLTAAQLGVWYALKAGIPMPAYNIGEYGRIFGAIDPDLFERAVRHVVGESEALCVRFIDGDDTPMQQIVAEPDWQMVHQDVSLEPDPVAVAESWMREDLAKPLDQCRGPFFNFALFKTAPEQFLWYGRFHHLVMDAIGGSFIVRRIADVYAALAAGAPVDLKTIGSLTDLIKEDAAYRASAHFRSDRQFWLDLMADCPEPPSLSIRAPTVPEQFVRRTAVLSSATTAQLQRFGQKVEMTFPQVVTLCTAIFVHRLTETEDVVLGQLLAARMSPTARQTPGLVANVVPLRVAIRPDMRVAELAIQVRRKIRSGIRHQRYSIAELRRDLRRIDRPIIRQHISLRPSFDDAQFAGFPVATTTVSNGPVDDLNIYVVYDLAEQGETRIEFVANPTLYDSEFLERLRLRFLCLLEALDDPEELVGKLAILPQVERRQILVDRNQTSSDYPRNRQVHELFEDQARRTPERVAVVYEQQQLTYRELNEQSDRVAQQLAVLGVGPDQRVGLCMERSPRMVAGLLGILKAGGAYVPLDLNYPRDRLAFILDDAAPLVLLTQQSLQDRFQPRNASILCLDELPKQPADTAREPPVLGGEASDPAYVLYTSGSTGRPKGVQIPHRALVNFLSAMRHEPGITAQDKLLAVTPLSFDIAGLELLLPLIVGAQVTIASSEVAADGFRLASLMQKCGATIMQATPATWRLLLEAGWQGNQCLKVLCGGEAWPAELAGELLPRCASLWNMYGPTETTVWSSVARIESNHAVLLGPPIANTTFYVLDRFGQPVPVGVPGELYIGGDGVACGYLNLPELTAERFVADPFSGDPAARMYETGDRVRYLLDGRLEFLGRLDHQVKIRGYRIELGEIEAVLRQHPDVADAVVVARDDAAGEKRLVAYMTASGDKAPALSSVRDLLRARLAPYMLPAALVPLETFPLTPNGKVDRNALPLPDDQVRHDGNAPFVAPRTPLEELLAGFWCECLHLKHVGVHDNFFDLGGDSLAMIRLSLEIEQATGLSFPLTCIFDAPTVAGMALALGGQKSIAGYSPLVVLRPGTGASPVFMVHPMSGSTMQLIPIAKAFPGRQPIYGIQAKGFDGTDTPYDRIDAMVDCYVSAITEVQPHGPYYLAGLCFGGVIAVEIARRLAERGEPIGLLAFLDTFPHPRHWPLRQKLDYFVMRRIRESLSALSELRRHEVGSYVSARLRLLLDKSVALVSGNQTYLKAPDFLPPAIKAVFEGGTAALEHYRPRYYPGKVNFLVCGYHEYPPEGARAVWGRLVEQLEVQSVPTDHALVASIHAEYVARWLFDRIQEATGLDGTTLAAAPRTNGLASVQEPSHILSPRMENDVPEHVGGSGRVVYSESRDHA
jgi:amino acid adenylation domain-containing protein